MVDDAHDHARANEPFCARIQPENSCYRRHTHRTRPKYSQGTAAVHLTLACIEGRCVPRVSRSHCFKRAWPFDREEYRGWFARVRHEERNILSRTQGRWVVVARDKPPRVVHDLDGNIDEFVARSANFYTISFQKESNRLVMSDKDSCCNDTHVRCMAKRHKRSRFEIDAECSRVLLISPYWLTILSHAAIV